MSSLSTILFLTSVGGLQKSIPPVDNLWVQRVLEKKLIKLKLMPGQSVSVPLLFVLPPVRKSLHKPQQHIKGIKGMDVVKQTAKVEDSKIASYKTTCKLVYVE